MITFQEGFLIGLAIAAVIFIGGEIAYRLGCRRHGAKR